MCTIALLYPDKETVSLGGDRCCEDNVNRTSQSWTRRYVLLISFCVAQFKLHTGSIEPLIVPTDFQCLLKVFHVYLAHTNLFYLECRLFRLLH